MNIKSIIDAWYAYPIIMSIITLILLIVGYIHRERLKPYLQSKFKFLNFNSQKLPAMRSFCDEIQYVYMFKSHLIAPDSKTFQKSMNKEIDICRKRGNSLILDFSEIEMINDDTIEAIRDVLRELINKNNIKALIVFPKKEMNSLYKDVYEFIDSKGSKTISIKKDDERRKKAKLI